MVYRHYRDYTWLYAKLLELFPDGVIVPPPSLKRAPLLVSDGFENVSDYPRVDLERFLVRIAQRSRFGDSEPFRIFLESSEHVRQILSAFRS